MKYLKIIGQIVMGKEVINTIDLADIKTGSADALVNLSDMTYFDADENTWKKIETF